MGLCPGDSCNQTFAFVLRAFLSSFITNSAVEGLLIIVVTLLLFPQNPRPAWDLFRGEAVRSDGSFSPSSRRSQDTQENTGFRIARCAVNYLGQAPGRQLWGLRAESHGDLKMQRGRPSPPFQIWGFYPFKTPAAGPE